MARSVRPVEVGAQAVETIERQDWLDRVGGAVLALYGTSLILRRRGQRPAGRALG